MTDQAPTPGQVLDMLVKRFIPVSNPRTTNPDPIGHAKRQLTCALLIEAFGADHPLAELVAAHRRYEASRYPFQADYPTILVQQEDAFRRLQTIVVQGS